MSNYIQIKIENISSQQSEILVAQLSGIGFDGFEEGENFLSAFIEEEKFDEGKLNDVLQNNFSYSKNILKQKNWNEEWEKNFEPVIVDDFVAVRAEFHEPIKNVEHEIIITPKMSFGTGHHATTYMMMQQMRSIDFKNKDVFDFGTGTGILAILAEKLGAASITAIDNDEWSIKNAKENIQKNNCKKNSLQLTDVPPSSKKFDIILANINRNVILENISALSKMLNKNAQMLVSGLLQEDEEAIKNAAFKAGLIYVDTIPRDKWILIKFLP